MNPLYVQVTYRGGKPFAAYIHFPHPPGAKSARTEEISPDLIIDYMADGSPLGIEIVSPGYVSVEEINGAFDSLGLPRPAPGDLDPLRVA